MYMALNAALDTGSVKTADRKIGNLSGCLLNGERVENGARQRLPCVKGAGPEGLRDCAVKCFNIDNKSAKRGHKGYCPF